MDPYSLPGHYGGPLTYGQTSRGGYTSGIIPTQSCTANMAPRPGYGIPLGGILPMAAPGSEIEKLPTLFIGGISWKNSQAYFRERAAARERERQREEEERANRRAKAEEERKRSHGRVIRERERERERERDHDKEEEQRRQAKRKTETEMAFKSRERRWQHHREETMATNREREAERDLDVREKQIRDWEIMARTEYTREATMEAGLNNEKEILTLATIAEDEEFDEEEGIIESKRGLWNWNVKWEELDENILNKKLQPFPAEDLTKEMMMTLEKYGGFGFMYILRYDETKGSDPNLQYWRVYVSFLREASPLNLDQLIKRKNAQKDESPSKEKDGKVKAMFTSPGHGSFPDGDGP
ncbi:hypothetical protein RhiirB3_444728 [Rhizophagus irregularis]|nr:hypothetical protein RhiirB3_444728 [Rhizophagus irregularis]